MAIDMIARGMAAAAQLPATTTGDAGKALMVNDAGTGVEWGEVSSGEIWTVTMNYDSSMALDTTTSDHTFMDLYSALNTGTSITCKLVQNYESMGVTSPVGEAAAYKDGLSVSADIPVGLGKVTHVSISMMGVLTVQQNVSPGGALFVTFTSSGMPGVYTASRSLTDIGTAAITNN